MKIEILGTGCPKCKKLYKNTEKAVNDMGLEAEVKKVKKMKDIMKYGVMITPALVIDGDVKLSGKVPAVEEMKGIIKKNG